MILSIMTCTFCLIEGAKIDAYCEDIVDLKAAYRKVVPYRSKFSEEEMKEAKDKWFDTPSSPPEADRSERCAP